jgi:hypothetical protein
MREKMWGQGGEPYAELVDDYTNGTYIYFCLAPIGSATSAAVWQIRRFTIATGLMLWADGNANFDNVADNRATSVSYS